MGHGVSQLLRKGINDLLVGCNHLPEIAFFHGPKRGTELRMEITYKW